MFDDETFRQLTDNVEADLIHGHLHDALRLLGESLDAELAPELKHEVSNIQADYNRLLHYMAEGSEDISRPALFARFITKTFRVLQQLRHDYRVAHGKDAYAVMAHACQYDWQEQFNQAINTLGDGMDYEAIDHLFELVWVAGPLDANDERQLRLFLMATDKKNRCHLLGALTLSLLHYFDVAKMRLLAEYATSPSADERARSIVGLSFACHLYASILPLYPTLEEQLKTLTQQDGFEEELTLLQHQFCLYQESERLQQKMEQEILPILIKASRERAKLGFDNDLEIDLTSPDSGLNLNKEARKRINESAKAMFQMFQEGVDVNLHTFTALKGFPFFGRIAHWLAPFDPHRPEVNDATLLRKFRLCDADLYSLCFLTQKIPEEQRKDLSQMLSNHSEEIEEQAREMGVSPIQNVVQCLYRLLRRSPWQSMWPDVFTANALLLHHPLFGPVLKASPVFLHTTGNTLLRHAHYEEAEEHLLLYSEKNGANSDLFCQLGYCEQQLGRYSKAIYYFRQADMLEPDKSQTLYHLQFCYARQARYEEQLECLLQLERLHPDEPRVLTETGLCLMQLNRWEEAQRRFFQMELRGQRLLPSLRAIAWCALRMKDYELAQRYYDRILGEELARTKWEDFLNAGHIAWIRGNVSTALMLYHEYARRYAADPEVKDILEPYNQDASILLEHGKSPSDIHLMYDLIARDL